MQYIDETKAVKLYDDFIDEITPQIQILGMGYFPSTVLKECDEMAYWCEFVNWLDSENLTTDKDEANDD